VWVFLNETDTTGNIWFVDSNAAGAGDAAGYGVSPDAPFATIDFAIGQCTANNGDRIYVAPGHAETVSTAAGIDFDVAGVRVIGLGHAGSRPVITMDEDVGTVHMDAAGSWLENMLFDIQADSTIVVDIDKADCRVAGCEFQARLAATAKEAVTCIDVTGAGANACDRARILDCVFKSPAAGASRAIELGEVADNVVIDRCVVIGDYADAGIHNPTGKVLTQLLIRDCLLENTQAGDHALELVSACTGMLVRNYYHTNALATAVDPGACKSFECYACTNVDKNGLLTPGVDA
jgi:hypothetical protein